MSVELKQQLEAAQTRIKELELRLNRYEDEEKNANPQAWKAGLLRLFTNTVKPLEYATADGLITMLNAQGYAVTGKDKTGNVDRLLNELNNLGLIRKFGTGVYGTLALNLSNDAKEEVAKLVQQNNSRKQSDASHHKALMKSTEVAKDAEEIQKSLEGLDLAVSSVLNKALNDGSPLLEEQIQEEVQDKLGRKVHFEAISQACKRVFKEEGKWKGFKTPKGFGYLGRNVTPPGAGYKPWDPIENAQIQTNAS